MSIVNNREFEHGGGIGVSEVSINPDDCVFERDPNRADILGEDNYYFGKNIYPKQLKLYCLFDIRGTRISKHDTVI